MAQRIKDFLPLTMLTAAEVEQVQSNGVIQVDSDSELTTLPNEINAAFALNTGKQYIRVSGAWYPLAQEDKVQKVMPVGIILPYMGLAIPTDWLKCNGFTFDQVIYPELYALLGVNTTPDMKDRFLKGAPYGDPGKVGGTKEISVAQLPEHSHGMEHDHSIDHRHIGQTDHDGGHTHKTRDGSGTGSSSWALDYLPNDNTYTDAKQNNGAHSHGIDIDSPVPNRTDGLFGGMKTDLEGLGTEFEPQHIEVDYLIKAR